MKAGAYIGLGWAILSMLVQLIFMGLWQPTSWLIFLIFCTVVGGMIGLAIELLIYLFNQIGRLLKH
jgi:hypothetical protein